MQRLRAKLASLPCAANRREIEAIIRATNAFAPAFVRLGELQAAFQNPLMRVSREATCPCVAHVNRARRPFKENLCGSSLRTNDSHVSLFFLTCRHAGIASARRSRR